ncbi:hypothetical protein NDU88_005801 [Pleurodeles waltl]|uniref:Uncharacterized protein n=1 Tax=Pleurodeles waltl TaxID=8319 RepID=A0AAV7LM77_PLEWA|nr:hypothetical protein NDU88_005801 [Pleurodeles waltl]
MAHPVTESRLRHGTAVLRIIPKAATEVPLGDSGEVRLPQKFPSDSNDPKDRGEHGEAGDGQGYKGDSMAAEREGDQDVEREKM